MSHNIFDAFTYLFKHKNWFAKILVGSLLFFFIKLIELSIKVLNSEAMPKLDLELLSAGNPSQVALYSLMSVGAIVLSILSIWMSAVLCGYFITAIRRYMRNQEDAIPDWDGIMTKLFFRGFKVFIWLFFISVIGYWFNVIVQNYSLFLLTVSTLHTALIVAFSAFFVCLYILFMMPALIIGFCETDKFFCLFNLVKAKQIAIKSIGQYTLTIFKMLFVVLICVASAMFLFHAKVGIIILPILFFYLLIVLGNIIGQYYVDYCKE